MQSIGPWRLGHFHHFWEERHCNMGTMQWVPTSCLHTASIVCWFSECFSSKSKENVIVVDICLKSSFFGFFLKITAKNLLDGIVLFTDESVVLICMTQRMPVCWCNTLDRAIPDLFTTVQSHGSLGGTAIATDLSAIAWYSFLLVWLKSWHTGVMIWYGTGWQTLSLFHLFLEKFWTYSHCC